MSTYSYLIKIGLTGRMGVLVEKGRSEGGDNRKC